MSRLALLLQITDSAFPVGAYAMSSGLESMVRHGMIRYENDVQAFIDTHITETLALSDLPLVRFAVGAQSIMELIEIDQRAEAIKPVPVFRGASQRLGRRFLDAFLNIRPATPALLDLRKAIGNGSTPGHHAVVFGAACGAVGIPHCTAEESFGYAAIQGYTAAAVRLGLIGQNRAQQLIAAATQTLDSARATVGVVHLDDLGGYTPSIDLAGLMHPRLEGRLFAS